MVMPVGVDACGSARSSPAPPAWSGRRPARRAAAPSARPAIAVAIISCLRSNTESSPSGTAGRLTAARHRRATRVAARHPRRHAVPGGNRGRAARPARSRRTRERLEVGLGLEGASEARLGDLVRRAGRPIGGRRAAPRPASAPKGMPVMDVEQRALAAAVRAGDAEDLARRERRRTRRRPRAARRSVLLTPSTDEQRRHRHPCCRCPGKIRRNRPEDAPGRPRLQAYFIQGGSWHSPVAYCLG